jgi:S1-C subfamily serine protease
MQKIALRGRVAIAVTLLAAVAALAGSQASGIGFAISSNQVKTVAARILAAAAKTRPALAQ